MTTIPTTTTLTTRTTTMTTTEPRASIRVRILLAVLALVALAFTGAGVAWFALERERAEDRIEDSLARTVTEVRAIASDDVDPETGLPFASARALLYVALQRFVPADHEAAFSIDATGDARQYAQLNPFPAQDDPDLLAALADAAHRDQVTLESVSTRQADYRVAVIPVAVELPDGSTDASAMIVVVDRGAELAEVNRAVGLLALVAAAASAASCVVAWFVVGRVLAPLRRLQRTAQEVSSTDLSRRIPVDGDDELAALTTTFNAMLDRLDAAFTAQRRLLDDVGHELRTPLTVMRGHLELMDAGDPADVEAVRGLALDEIDRTDALVDDLVTIARAGRPDFLRPAAVDVALLTDDVLAKARGLGERRWRLDALAEGEAVLDARRVTQALLQLAANAVRYSEPGSTVAVGSRRREGDLLLWVRDEGVGISPQETRRVLDRFATGAHATRESTGLGLAIVHSIALAHGGDVEIDSEPGAGTTVTLVLPLTGGRPT
ncbi:signal transduction histidine kinase [Salana multivorans]|uniref:histidine kinase n=1 Tax=Salana multivorans TaxID=120377 RepID=A0A3N2DC88_9MICO|nr:ATP-binding protein [Salana multivorans]ROR97322.1 signal transduction histidine kinase [Salana multivorans]